jgi:hypothetical protein
MKKVREYLNKKSLKGDVGIEIECEGKGFVQVDTEVWRSEDDGSLRGRYPDSRVEYVLNKPIPITTVRAAVLELNELIKDAKPNFSFRTSVHVHVNVLELTEEQLFSFIYTYLLLEEPLFYYCGNTRKCNRFCLRLQDTDSLAQYLYEIFSKGIEKAFLYNENHVRYGAINIAALKKYGSLEFRGMRGTLDVETLDIWTNALISIRNSACNHKNCLTIHDEFVKKGPEGFLDYVLGNLSENFKYKSLVKDMQRSYSLSIDLPYTFKKHITPIVEFQKKEPKADIPIVDDILLVAPGIKRHDVHLNRNQFIHGIDMALEQRVIIDDVEL